MIFYYSFKNCNNDIFYDALSKKFQIAKLEIHEVHFVNGEVYLNSPNNILPSDYVILNFDNDLYGSEYIIPCALITSLLSHLTENIIIYMPYIPYELQSEYKKNSSVGFDIFKSLFDKNYIKKIVTIDSHISSISSKFANTNVANISLMEDLITKNIKIFKNSIIVLPDKGARNRYEHLLQKFSLRYIVLEKSRDFGGNVKIKNNIDTNFATKNKFIFLDDMMLSGKTLIEVMKIIPNINYCMIIKNFNKNFNQQFPNITLIQPYTENIMEKVLSNICETIII